MTALILGLLVAAAVGAEFHLYRSATRHAPQHRIPTSEWEDH